MAMNEISSALNSFKPVVKTEEKKPEQITPMELKIPPITATGKIKVEFSRPVELNPAFFSGTNKLREL